MRDDASDSDWIEIFVDDWSHLFQSFDPSPFHERVLDEDAHRYIVDSAREFPQQNPRGLIIYVDRPSISEDEAQSVATAVRKHFARRALAADAALKQNFREARASLSIALPVLTLAVAAAESAFRTLEVEPLNVILRESLLIGGWVAMWRPIELFLYEWWPIRDARNLYQRLSRLEVRVLPYASAPQKADLARARQ